MKKIILLAFMFLTLSATAQNLQFLSDGKQHFGTFETLTNLDHGKLYSFTDFKLSKFGFNEAYTEISVYRNIFKKFYITGQYNAGVNKSFNIFPVYLTGASKTFTLGENTELTIDLLYRHQPYLYFPNVEKRNGYQLTSTIFYDLPKIQITGYVDFWNTKYYIFEPQAWYKLLKKIWVGLEWRNSNYDNILNYDDEGIFIGDYANYIMFGAKYNFVL